MGRWTEVGTDNYFDAAQGLYWYAADYHEGQSSDLYSILSTLDYHPGAMESKPDEEGMVFYMELEDGRDPAELREAINMVIAVRHG
jgi:hypothetical protein